MNAIKHVIIKYVQPKYLMLRPIKKYEFYGKYKVFYSTYLPMFFFWILRIQIKFD